MVWGFISASVPADLGALDANFDGMIFNEVIQETYVSKGNTSKLISTKATWTRATATSTRTPTTRTNSTRAASTSTIDDGRIQRDRVELPVLVKDDLLLVEADKFPLSDKLDYKIPNLLGTRTVHAWVTKINEDGDLEAADQLGHRGDRRLEGLLDDPEHRPEGQRPDLYVIEIAYLDEIARLER